MEMSTPSVPLMTFPGLPVPLPVEPRTHADRYGLTNATGKGFYELAGNPRTRVSSAVG